ncbi:PilZ domain-containing protein [Salidesulfovibrio onnuriiensis]|uniref:PilZ domain-containing protein n=1 Tax=Salidesulfovibrio onnuriiensis TaxID=2583823 RepID=UPI0011CCAEB7|nr:PilZ domain-containing protein [Salidesulfovibrio onnuriiensis]
MKDEKRSFSRVEARLNAYVRHVESLETPPIFSSAPALEACSREVLSRGGHLPEPLISFLCEMDKKLDQVLSFLSQDQIRNDFPMSIEIFELSGAGAKFRTTDPLSEGDKIELVLVLNQFPLRLAGTKGRIVGKEEDIGMFRLEFVNIREADLENIIQYVFQKQREIIRNAKRD